MIDIQISLKGTKLVEEISQVQIKLKNTKLIEGMSQNNMMVNLTVKGDPGDDGKSITIIEEKELADGSKELLFSDGSSIVLPRGQKGEDGHTPVVGVDFFNDEDKKQMLKDINISRIDDEDIERLF